MSEQPIVSGMLVYNPGDNKVYLKTATGSAPIGVSSDFLGRFNDDVAAEEFAATITEEIRVEGTRYWNLTYQRFRQYVSGSWADQPMSGEITAAVEAAESARDAILNRAPVTLSADHLASPGDLIRADMTETWTLTLPATGGEVAVIVGEGAPLMVDGGGRTIDGDAIADLSGMEGFRILFSAAAGDTAWRYVINFTYGD